jgi:hypothetical protein
MTTKTDKRYREMTRTRAGKGDALRPMDKKKFNENWERIFGNDSKKDTKENAQDVPQATESFGQEKI